MIRLTELKLPLAHTDAELERLVLQALSLNASDLAWEWLRRNETYEADFEASSLDPMTSGALTERIRQRWGLRFPRKPTDSSS